MQTAHDSKRFVELKAGVTAKVQALPNLTAEQRARVLDIAIAYVDSHSGQEIHYDNVAAHVRSYTNSQI